MEMTVKYVSKENLLIPEANIVVILIIVKFVIQMEKLAISANLIGFFMITNVFRIVLANISKT